MKINNIAIIVILALILSAAAASHCYAAGALACLCVYILHALLFSDHIGYNCSSDYSFNFGKALSFPGTLAQSQFTLLAPLDLTIDTCVLGVTLESRWLGFIFDPYIELRGNNQVSRQYFERGGKGKRFLNLSRIRESLQQTDGALTLYCKYCSLQQGSLTLLGFANPDYCSKRVLVIAPHADDAELAAFAFYKHTASVLIATVTAGENQADTYKTLTRTQSKVAAGTLKGRLRAWDSIAIPRWAGPHVKTIHLGYCGDKLKAMSEQPALDIASAETGHSDISAYRFFNDYPLPSDNNNGDTGNSWHNLIADLTAIIAEFQPDIIVTPHPMLDPHSDHIYSTYCTLICCEAARINPQFLLYANHYQHTDMYPFGLEHSDLPLPPHFDHHPIAEKLYSFPLSDQDQIDKICALQMMHDLNRKQSTKKQLRRFLQRVIGRSKMPYGDDEYLRKAIRQQELFWVDSMEQVKLHYVKNSSQQP